MSTDLCGLRIGLLTASASRLGGGVFEAVVQQAALIRAHGGEAPVFALEDQHSAADAHRFAGSTVRWSRVRGPAQVGFAPGLVAQLAAAKLDCLHLHGIWMYPSHAGSQWARAHANAYVISPHGMLDPWITARGRWKKAFARFGYERASWARAQFLHALTAHEAADIAAESGRRDSAIIANPAPAITPGPIAPRGPQLAYIGRIHPKKNLLALIAGWQQARRPADSRLVLAGWGAERDVAQLQACAASAGPSVEFVGPVYAADKQELLEQSRFVVLPSLSEGLPMAILESWAAATPTIMSDACNLSEGFTSNGALRCGTTPEAIAATIEQAFAFDNARWLILSQNARALAAGTFSASAIADHWVQTYHRAIAGQRLQNP